MKQDRKSSVLWTPLVKPGAHVWNGRISVRKSKSQAVENSDSAGTGRKHILLCGTDPCYGENCQGAGIVLVLLFLLHIKNCLCLFFSSFRLCSIRLAFSGSAQGLLTWLNLLSVQPRGRTSYRFQDWPEKRTEPIL